MPSDRRQTDRRSYLKFAGAAAVTALAGCSGGNGGDGGNNANHEVPHPDDGTVPDAEATAETLGGQTRPKTANQAKDAIEYSHTPSGEEHCGNCKSFVPDANGDGFGACSLVKGKIHHCDWCNLYSSYSGDGTVACES